MQDAFAIVLFVVVGVGILGAIVSLVLSSGAWDEIGKGGFFREDTDVRPTANGVGGDRIDVAERDAEIRQMLEARNARRAAKGQDVVDVEDELARLTAPVIDDDVRQEVRDMVVARNHRRVRKGQEPLDVEAEVERRVRELGG
jgi:hypothetical protein